MAVVVHVNHLNVYVESEGQGEPLVFIHGLGASCEDWSKQSAFFKDRYQVLRFDLRGHGQTEKPEGNYSIAQFTADTKALLAHFFPTGAHIVGHSLGGMIAFQLVVDAPELVKTLTILNSAPSLIPNSFSYKLWLYWRGIHLRLFGMPALSAQLGNLLFPEPQQAMMREHFIARWKQNDPIAYRQALAAFYQGWSVMDKLKNITCPTLILAADQDYSPLAYKQSYTQQIPKAILKEIKHSRHMSHWDQTEIFNQYLGEFLAIAR